MIVCSAIKNKIFLELSNAVSPKTKTVLSLEILDCQIENRGANSFYRV